MTLWQEILWGWIIMTIAPKLIVIPIWRSVAAAAAGSADAVGLALVGTLLSLAILEHLFLVIPLPFDALWKWGLRSRVSHLSEAQV